MRRALALGLAVVGLAAPATAAAAFPAKPPNDPLFDASPLPNATNEQWDLASPAVGFDRGISADRAWALTTGAGVSIADIDVGVDLDHPDLAGRWLANPGVDGDGRDEVAVSAFTGKPELFRGDGTRMSRTGEGNHFQSLGRGGSSPAGAPASLAIGANAAFGRTSRGGPLRLFGGLVDLRLAQAQASPASRVPFEHLLGGWDARSGSWLPAFPRPLEGWTILSGPAVADVDGDGSAEALAGSSGYRLHAVGESGREPAGWPKQTGGWLIAAPAVGDVDGDRRLEVVAVTREGWLFVWNTPAPKGSMREWPVFRHDRRNSGRHR